MIREQVNSLGFDLTKEHPESVAEYNALAPKRLDACREDAVASTDYRSVFPTFRRTFLEALGEQLKIERINHGTEEKPDLEKEGVWFKRMVAGSGLSREAFTTTYKALAQQHMDAAPFDPSLREGSSDGPAIGKRDLALAATVIKDGKADAVAAKLAAILNREVASDEKSLARAIADNRRAIAAAAEQAQKAQLGL